MIFLSLPPIKIKTREFIQWLQYIQFYSKFLVLEKNHLYRKGKLNLVDLAGSERHGKTGKIKQFTLKTGSDKIIF